jgi:hypothetical protein
MNLSEKCGIVAFLTESCPAVVQALYLLSLQFTLSSYQRYPIYADLTYFILDFFTEVSASKHLNTTTRNFLFSFFKETFIYFVRWPDKCVRRVGCGP